jgi:hypothetical protein
MNEMLFYVESQWRSSFTQSMNIQFSDIDALERTYDA